MENIKLYSKNGESLDIEDYSIIDNGKRSDIYSNNKDMDLRVYHGEIPVVKTINEKHFNAIKDIKHEALPVLGDLYYNTDNVTPFDPVMAYSCERIEKDDTLSKIDFNTEDGIDFIVNKVITRVIGAANVLADNGYSLSIPQKGDIIVNKDGAYLVDPNKFIKEPNLSREELIRINQMVALRYIRTALIDKAKESATITILNSSLLEETITKILKMSA